MLGNLWWRMWGLCTTVLLGVIADVLVINATAATTTIRKCVASEVSARGEPLVSQIAFGSCANQSAPQPIWNAIIEFDPQVFIWLGSNCSERRGHLDPGRIHPGFFLHLSTKCSPDTRKLKIFLVILVFDRPLSN
ncbi:hypothetical protein K2173_007489 [Erythroxylum novogranatense]|uniref:Uncharacterized protein n=1 Tax=Erythroxylum novogranatense TaxID=1862640 RepID=A0AAV8S650_9ROSI|nr:hypothetical protein K2173_007489 [Erythroxylum novogranatense]